MGGSRADVVVPFALFWGSGSSGANARRQWFAFCYDMMERNCTIQISAMAYSKHRLTVGIPQPNPIPHIALKQGVDCTRFGTVQPPLPI